MNSTANRLLLTMTWLAALLAMGAGALEGKLGVVLQWALPVALLGTALGIAARGRRLARAALAAGLSWQVALIGAYWPASLALQSKSLNGTLSVPAHSWVIGAVLICLLASFLLLYVAPAASLSNRLRRVHEALEGPAPLATDAAFAPLIDDPQLAQRAQQYLAQLVRLDTVAGTSGGADCSSRPAGDFFDLHDMTHARLRTDFFRHLPGMFTGVGIIGTFAGLILGLSSFKVTGDTAAVQQSLDALLAGVWEAFLVSAAAIGMAIAVTIVERWLVSSLARRVEHVTQALDARHPLLPPSAIPTTALQPSPSSAATAATAANAGANFAPGGQDSLAVMPVPPPLQPSAPMRQPPTQPAPPAATAPAVAAAEPASAQWQAQLEQTLQANAAANRMLAEMAQSLPALLAQQLERAQQGNQQAAQAMRTLSARLEGVASGIEVSARKTLETVAARMMQAEMAMVSRHHGVAEHLADLVKRIETLCELMQQDRFAPNPQHHMGGFPLVDPAPALRPLPKPPGASAGANAPLQGIRRNPMMPDDGGQGTDFIEGVAQRHASGGAWDTDDPWGSPDPARGGFGP